MLKAPRKKSAEKISGKISGKKISGIKSAGKNLRHALVKAAPRARLHEAGKDGRHRAVVETLAAIRHKARVGEALGQVLHRLGLARAGRSRGRAAHVKGERLRCERASDGQSDQSRMRHTNLHRFRRKHIKESLIFSIRKINVLCGTKRMDFVDRDVKILTS